MRLYQKNLVSSVIPSTPSGSGNGYFGGGYDSVYTRFASMAGLNFLSEVSTSLSASLSEARARIAGTQSSTKGYFVGGESKTIIEGLTFATQTAFKSATTIFADSGTLGAGQSSTTGYFAGSATYGTSITSLTFATDSKSEGSYSMHFGRCLTTGISSSSSCYFAGGYTSISPNYLSSVEKLSFSSSVIVLLGSGLPSASYQSAGMYSSTKGYIAGGQGSTVLNKRIVSLTFSVEALTTISASLTRASGAPTGSSSSNKGYCAGDNAFTANVESINFTTETSSTLSSTLPFALSAFGAVSNAT